VARKQIELATCGLRQITVKLWKFFFAANKMVLHLIGVRRYARTLTGHFQEDGSTETVQCLGLHVHQT
jgi:hypothetical protein